MTRDLSDPVEDSYAYSVLLNMICSILFSEHGRKRVGSASTLRGGIQLAHSMLLHDGLFRRIFLECGQMVRPCLQEDIRVDELANEIAVGLLGIEVQVEALAIGVLNGHTGRAAWIHGVTIIVSCRGKVVLVLASADCRECIHEPVEDELAVGLAFVCQEERGLIYAVDVPIFGQLILGACERDGSIEQISEIKQSIGDSAWPDDSSPVHDAGHADATFPSGAFS